MTGLQYASLNGHCDIVKWLIGLGADVNATDTYGRTALHWAGFNAQTEVAALLWEAGADAMAKSPGGLTPYGFVCQYNTRDNEAIHFFRREVRRAYPPPPPQQAQVSTISTLCPLVTHRPLPLCAMSRSNEVMR